MEDYKSTEILNNVSEVKRIAYQNVNVKLWNPGRFIIFSALLSFLPAAILYSLNYGRLGDTKKKNISLFFSIIGFALMISASMFINISFMKYICYAINIAAGSLMNTNQSPIYKKHISYGGQKASYLVPVLASIAVMIAIVVFIVNSGAMNIPDQKLIFKESELYYTTNVQKSEAQKLGDYLINKNFFNDSRKVSIKIDKQSNTYRFSLIVSKENLNDQEVEKTLKDFCKELSKNIFDGNKVNIILCDDTFEPLKTISSD